MLIGFNAPTAGPLSAADDLAKIVVGAEDELFNADQFIYNNYEIAAGKGFKGAKLSLVMVLMDIDPNTGGYLFWPVVRHPITVAA